MARNKIIYKFVIMLLGEINIDRLRCTELTRYGSIGQTTDSVI